MIAITDGFTRIATGTDPIWPRGRHQRSATGARVTLEFCRDTPLLAGQPVCVRYDIAGDGTVREGAGFALPTRIDARWGHGAVYHYRLSYWIEPEAIMQFVAPSVRVHVAPSATQRQFARDGEAPAGDPSPA